ncbi:MAG: cell division protein FtsW [Opitutales bacterium]|nr:cell division protein FtsW [Opitutales bacterium]
MSESDIKGSNRRGVALQMAGVFIPVILLSLWGIITIFSAGAAEGPEKLVNKQAFWFCIALAGFVAAYKTDLDFLKKLAIPIAVITIAMLVAVLIPGVGKTVKGSTRWIAFGSISVQPSDFAKISLVICLAAAIQYFQRDIKTFWKGTMPPIAITAMFVLPILKEPDFGTSMLCVAVGGAVMFMAGIRLTHLFGFGLAGVSAIARMVLKNPNRLTRLASFLNREAEAQDGGYQLTQAIYAFGAGGVHGAGPGQGRQQYSFLPEAHTDFIFANIAEEFGLIGTSLVLLLFFAIFASVFFSLKRARNLYEFSLCFGAVLMLTGQALFNMCVVVGLLPTKGISLPFMSYGGSNLVVMFAFTGIILNCLKRWSVPQKIKATDYE